MEEFHRLDARTDLAEIEQELIARFVGGLRSDIKEKVALQLLGFLPDGITLVTRFEDMNDSCFKSFYSKGMVLKNQKGNERQWV